MYSPHDTDVAPSKNITRHYKTYTKNSLSICVLFTCLDLGSERNTYNKLRYQL